MGNVAHLDFDGLFVFAGTARCYPGFTFFGIPGKSLLGRTRTSGTQNNVNED